MLGYPWPQVTNQEETVATHTVDKGLKFRNIKILPVDKKKISIPIRKWAKAMCGVLQREKSEFSLQKINIWKDAQSWNQRNAN